MPNPIPNPNPPPALRSPGGPPLISRWVILSLAIGWAAAVVLVLALRR